MLQYIQIQMSSLCAQMPIVEIAVRPQLQPPPPPPTPQPESPSQSDLTLPPRPRPPHCSTAYWAGIESCNLHSYSDCKRQPSFTSYCFSEFRKSSKWHVSCGKASSGVIHENDRDREKERAVRKRVGKGVGGLFNHKTWSVTSHNFGFVFHSQRTILLCKQSGSQILPLPLAFGLPFCHLDRL